jgi:hypothetical protein
MRKAIPPIAVGGEEGGAELGIFLLHVRKKQR